MLRRFEGRAALLQTDTNARLRAYNGSEFEAEFAVGRQLL